MENGGENFLLKAQGIQKVFRKGRQEISVVKGVDLMLRQGEMASIMGSSGVGKSTFLHILGTLETASSGKYEFSFESGSEGKLTEVFKLSPAKLAEFRNRVLGFVFQFHHLLPEFTALENVMMPALIAGYSRAEATRQAEELLKFVGLGERLRHSPSELSGGEQQRVAISRAVILRPKLLLADELTGNLDSKNRELVLELLAELNRKTGVAVLLVTHDLEVAAKMHRRFVMKDGQLSELL